MPVMKRQNTMPSPVVWNAMITELTEYQSKANVKTRLRP